MYRVTRVLLVGGVAVLVLVMMLGCPLPEGHGGGPAGKGWFIRLNVSAPAPSRSITATEYQVTGLTIEVRDPDDKLLQTISWVAADGPKSYLVPVEQQGEYEIRVTHAGEKNGETVETTESTTVNIQAMKIAVIDIVPGSIGLINVKPEATPINMTGFWNFLFTIGGQTTSGAIYFLQTGSSLNGLHGLTGTVEGSTVTWGGTGPSGTTMTATGTAQGNNKVSGTISDGTNTGTWETTRAVYSFGTLNMDGLVTVHTDKALGEKYVPDPEYRLEFAVPSAWQLFYGFGFWSEGTAFPVGQDLTVTEKQNDDPTKINAGVDGRGAQSGNVHFTSYSAGVAVATFHLGFAGGDSLDGQFNLSGPGGTLTINNGSMWKGSPLSGSWSVGSWSAYMQDNANDTVRYVNEDVRVRLDVGRHTEQGTGTFEVPAQRNVYFAWQPDSGAEIKGDAVSGTLTIDEYTENVRIKGHFSLQFPSGALSGNFDVPPTTEAQF